MALRSVEIAAAEEAQAMELAAEQLETAPDNIQLSPIGEGMFRAYLTNCDADADVEVSDDGMAAYVSARPAKGTGGGLTPNVILKALAEAGVRRSPDAEALDALVLKVNGGATVEKELICRGTRSIAATDATIDPVGNWNYPVLPGGAVGRFVPAKPAKPGADVFGKRLPMDGKERGADIVFPEDGLCHIDKVSDMVRSETYGLAIMDGQEVRVIPQIEISRDGMQAVITFHEKDNTGKPLNAERLQEALNGLDIVESVDGRALVMAKKLLKETGQPVKDVVICRGKQPVNGEDGWFDMLIQDERSDVGTETEDGRVDFRARGIVRSVQQGELLGRLQPPTAGRPGRDIYGRVIVARDGEPFPLNVGEGVVQGQSEDEFVAEDVGMVFFIDNLLSVTEVFQTRGDVNMSVGNIELEKGSVHVRGSILSGFSVKSPKNILVDEVVESAVVVAGGDIQIKGGIMVDKGGHVKAGGGVSAMFAKNARIMAKGDVNIAHELNNCDIIAGKKVIARRGRGKIIGCRIQCTGGVHANELGSEMGVETVITLGSDRRVSEADLKRRRALEQMLQKIFAAIGKGSPREILERTAPAKREAVAEVLKRRISAEHELDNIIKRIEREREEIRKLANATIKVYGCIHPGVTINVFGKGSKIQERMERTMIFLHPGTGRLEFGTL